MKETAARERRRARLAGEVAALIADPAYVVEAVALAALMEEHRSER
jgi:hypothetical protein